MGFNGWEEWVPVVGYEGFYEVSNQGRVRSLDRRTTGRDGRNIGHEGRVLKPTGKGKRRRTVRLTRIGEQRRYVVAHLVLEAFVGPPPEGTECLHWDDDPSNNEVSNLRWGTRSENINDMVRNGNHNHARKTHCVNGHLLSEENVYLDRTPTGYARDCRKCRKARSDAFQARKKDKANGI